MKKKNTLKLFAIVISCVLMAGVFTACKSNNSKEALSEAKQFKIGIVQYEEDETLNLIRESFMDRLEEWGYDENKVIIDYQNGKGKQTDLDEICKKFVTDEVDLIVAIAEPSAQAAKLAVDSAEESKVKIIFACESDISDLKVSGENITGAVNKINSSTVIDFALKVNPEIKSFGVFYNSNDEDAVEEAKELKLYLDSLSIEIVEGLISNEGEVQQKMTELCEKVDAVLIIEDDIVMTNSATAIESAKSLKTPLYARNSNFVKEGAFAAIEVDHTKIGKEIADQCVQAIEGKPISEISVRFFEEYDVYINQSTLNAVGVNIPEDIKATAILFE